MAKWDFSKIKEWGWKEHPTGGVIPEAATTDSYATGGWRSVRPVLDSGKCVHCYICFIFCPDSSIVIKDGKMTGFNLRHCKGCGICAEVCPAKAVSMMNEAEAQGLEKCHLAGQDLGTEKSA